MIGASRREFLKAGGGLAATQLVWPLGLRAQHVEAQEGSTVEASGGDLRQRISKSDLVYTKPVTRSEEGIPIGNGRMGSLVWTTPSKLRLQINRVDVYASDATSNSFVEPHNDYCGGCAFLDVDFGSEVFPAAGFQQHLQVFDGRLLIEGRGVRLEVFALFAQDAFAILVSDQRSERSPVTATLCALRFDSKYERTQVEVDAREHASTVQTRSHTARIQLLAGERSIALVQEFREGRFFCQSGVAVSFANAPGVAEIASERDVQLRSGNQAPACILIGSAASFDSRVDIASEVQKQLNEVSAIAPATLRATSQQWWNRFWERGSLELKSKDGVADFVQANYHYFFYLMASTSQGKFPVKFNGMLWNTGGDLRMWGAQHWWTNLSCYYEAVPASGRFELMEPLFAMYSGMFDACANAARQEWGSKGIYIPETVFFDGLERLPDPIAEELQALYLERKPWKDRSAAFLSYASVKHPYSSVWNWMGVGHWKDGRFIVPERGDGPYGPTSHWITATAKIPYLYWRHYEYTQDREWLRTRAYPMLAGAVEFYRCHPNVYKAKDGKYHIHGTNNGEPVKGIHDACEDIAAMKAVTAALLRAAELLQADQKSMPVWREFHDNIAPLPTSDNPDAVGVDNYHGPRVLVSGLKPVVHPAAQGVLQDINSMPTWFFDLGNVETSDREMSTLSRATFEQVSQSTSDERVRFGGLSKLAVAAASLGHPEAVTDFIPKQMKTPAWEKSPTYNKGSALANRMSLLEGVQALGAEHLGRASEALHMALLQSNPPAPGEDAILHCFPAWPKDWEATFTLSARGGFTVTASIQGGVVGALELVSNSGSLCRLRNPYQSAVEVYRNGARAESLKGSLLEFKTTKGETISIKPQA